MAEEEGVSPKPDPSVRVRDVLREHGLSPRKALGQNFLADPSICSRIAGLAASGLHGILEIGAGLGALTAPLLAASTAIRVQAVETDGQLVQVLQQRLADAVDGGQLTLHHADARHWDWEGTLRQMPGPRGIAGNLPYHLSGLLLRKAVEAAPLIERAVFLLQLEVVDRLCASPATPEYGALSVFAQAVFQPRRAFVVKRKAFVPSPGVDSAVVVLETRQQPVLLDSVFSELVRAAFAQRRKTLRNAWQGVCGLEREALVAAASQAGIELQLRGEVLSVAAFEAMAEECRRRCPR